MLDRLLAALEDAELLLSDADRAAVDHAVDHASLIGDEDIADALWLASFIGSAEPISAPAPATADQPQQPLTVYDDSDPAAALPPPPAVPAFMPRGGAGDDDSDPAETGLPLQVQAAPALPNALALGRALRPLMRPVPSRTRQVLDELATVDRIAQEDLWLPVLQPEPERWFDLHLVIERSPLSPLWVPTLTEFQCLLEQQGAFRTVRPWQVDGSNPHHPSLHPSRQGSALPGESGGSAPSSTARSPHALIDPAGRTLVLYISDGRSPLWHQGTIHEWLALWGQHQPTALVQLLPQRLWPDTALKAGYPVQVSAFVPGVANPELRLHQAPARLAPDRQAPASTLTLPVVTLTASALGQWARVIAAVGQQRLPARLFDLAWVQAPARQAEAEGDAMRPDTPDARLELFAATTTPEAQRLARLMAVVPVELPVVHLLQRVFFRGAADPLPIAEVYSSALMERQGNRYDFAPGLRDRLQKQNPIDETLDVLDALSQEIARTLGFKITSFTALLNPHMAQSTEAQAAILPFARIATEVLHRLGGQYADLARLVEQDGFLPPPPHPPLPTDGAADPFPPPLETETFTIVTFEQEEDAEPEPDLELFEFAVVTLRRSQDGSLRESTQPQRPRKSQQEASEWEIERQSGQAYRYVELLPESLPLEMVAIPAGTFLMGSPDDEPERYDDEAPQHEVTVPEFFLGRYPITQSQWRAVAALPQVEQALEPDPSNFKGDNRPVERVSWHDAVEFCARLSAHSGRLYRLSTEAEWEYACRAGTTTPFHFGEMISTEVANYDGSAYNNGPTGENRGETTLVDHLDHGNPWGLSDMHGNVWEWCEDHWHSRYEGAPMDGSAWLDDNAEENASRIRRGGSWINGPGGCRSAYRDDYFFPRGAYYFIGFRVVCSAPRTLP